MASWFGFGGNKETKKRFTGRDLKVQCKSAVIRLQLRKQKTANLIKVQRREIAHLLKKGEDENARVLVEQIIKDEYKCDAYDELEVYCEELLARQGLIETSRLPLELKEPICTLIWTALRTDVKELNSIRELMAAKFGQNLDHEALLNVDECVNPKVMERLGPNPPEEVIVFSYLNSIAEEYGLDWRAVEAVDLPDDDPLAGLEDEEMDYGAGSLAAVLPSTPGSQASVPEHMRMAVPSQPDLIAMTPQLQHATPMVMPVMHSIPTQAPASLDDFASMFAAVPSAGGPPSASVQPSQAAMFPTVPTVNHSTPLTASVPGVSDGDLEAEFNRMMGESPPQGDPLPTGPPPAADYSNMFDSAPTPVSNPSLATAAVTLAEQLAPGPEQPNAGSAPVKMVGMDSFAPAPGFPTDGGAALNVTVSADPPSVTEGDSSVQPSSVQPSTSVSSDPPAVSEYWASKFGLDVGGLSAGSAAAAPAPAGAGQWATLDPSAQPGPEPNLTSQAPADTLAMDDMDELFSRLSALKNVQ